MVWIGGGVGVDWNFGQVSPWFRPWIMLGIVSFLGFGDVSGSGGIWEEARAWLTRIGGEEWMF